MDTILITSIIVGCVAAVGFILYAVNSKRKPHERPNINIDFDLAKEREDKNRYFS
ncbi:hypothetical protein GM415_13190 [Pseudodesulfovibrio cashew]|uniref:Uncharacterized protein n=1 Tax=Pseudodesulfovibrio cashew TaxID=2678688 RepID=A0A6I6JIZ1_9BACT|nr:hypothetical protein [Pseudodesulfovibrio cashew]QGY41040.1 hypothetical protein GM415_13190 [Pseudodesulfovibrio cashew]